QRPVVGTWDKKDLVYSVGAVKVGTGQLTTRLGESPWGVLRFSEQTKGRGSQTLLSTQDLSARGGIRDDCRRRRIRASAGMGQGTAAPDQCDGRANDSLGDPGYSGGPASHACGRGTGAAGRATGERAGTLDPGAPVVDGTRGGPS